MKKTLKDELLRIQDLEANIEASKQILKREKARLEALQKECSHDIVILAEVTSPGYALKAKCLLCGKHYDSPHALRELPSKSIQIDACNFKKLQYYSENEIYDFIANESQLATLKNPTFTKGELGEYLKQLLKED